MGLSILTNFLALDVGAAFEDALNSLLLNINIAVYNLINFLYNLFENLAVAEFLDNSIIEGVYQRVGLILGLFMIFKLTFSLIQTMINPIDEKIKGSTKLITKMIIVIILLGTTNTIFNEARRLQENVLVNDNIISKVILGRDSSPEDDFGMVLASETFFTFYTDTEDPYFNGPGYNPEDKDYFNELVTEDCDGDGDPSNDNNCMVKFKNLVINEQDLNLTKYLINSRSKDTGWFDAGLYYVEFNGFICLAVGIFMLYILLSYCFAVGVRTVQLAFLQLIAPIPIISYIDPKDETAFSKWLKLCITTYVDVFIRVAIIYFIVFMIKGVMDSDINYLLSSSTDGTSLLWIKIVLFLALLMFAKKAPDLIHEMFPKATGSIGFGLSLKEKFSNMLGGGLIAGAIGAAGAATLGAAGAAVGNAVYGYKNKNSLGKTMRSMLAGSVSGGLRGAKAGFQNGIKGGIFGIGKAGISGIEGASIARNQRDPRFGMKYGWGDKLKDQFAQTTGQRQKFGASGAISGEIKDLENRMANRQSAIETGLQQIRDAMGKHETLKSAFDFNVSTGNYEKSQNIKDYNDYLTNALNSMGTTLSKLQQDAMYRSQITGNSDIIELKNMLNDLGVANSNEFKVLEDNIADVNELMKYQAEDKKSKGQLEGSLPKRNK